MQCFNVLREHGVLPANIRAMTLVTAPEGIKNFLSHHPDIRVYSAALDEKLDNNSYILPGLGDAGDRMYQTT